MKRVLAGFALGALAFDGSAMAADISPGMALKAPRLIYDWTGFYLGGHIGYGGGSFGPGSNPLPAQGVFLPPSPTGPG